MGKFANTPEEMGESGTLYTGKVPRNEKWHGQSEFDAMGHVVPFFRRAAAEEHLKQMGFKDAEQRYDIVNVMSDRIARDNTHDALEQGFKKGMDATACYRILSVLLCAPQPEEEAA